MHRILDQIQPAKSFATQTRTHTCRGLFQLTPNDSAQFPDQNRVDLTFKAQVNNLADRLFTRTALTAAGNTLLTPDMNSDLHSYMQLFTEAPFPEPSVSGPGNF